MPSCSESLALIQRHLCLFLSLQKNYVWGLYGYNEHTWEQKKKLEVPGYLSNFKIWLRALTNAHMWTGNCVLTNHSWGHPRNVLMLHKMKISLFTLSANFKAFVTSREKFMQQTLGPCFIFLHKLWWWVMSLPPIGRHPIYLLGKERAQQIAIVKSKVVFKRKRK